MKKVNLFHIGPQKSGTTWLYRALKDHYQVSSSESDSIHYIDIFYHRGESWYHRHFKSWSERAILDPTFSYIRDKDAPKKIYEYNPKAKIMLTARNPVERAFSHYWHEKRKDRFNFYFEEILSNYDLFANWVEPGLYASHYKNYLRYFPERQIKILFFDDLEKSPRKFFENVCCFCEIDRAVEPSIIDRKLNTAGGFRRRSQRLLENKLANYTILNYGLRLKNKIIPAEHDESLENVSQEVKDELVHVFRDDICELEGIAGRDLSAWKKI